ncbi:MAG: hypothetical protein IPK73_30790 [Candidatus Obscuribacter sp.]|nr:hypothetical protein [Candidatus Obscuribacter sp.]
MRRTFHTITEQDNSDTIAENIVHREREVYQYDLNIENYEALLETLPKDDWPEHLVQYQGKTADQIPDEYDEICNQLNYRDRVRRLLKTERQELAKAEAILNVLLEKIPENGRAAKIAAALQRILAREGQ